MRNLKVGDLVSCDYYPGSLVVIGEGEIHPTTGHNYSTNYTWVLPLDPSAYDSWLEKDIRVNGIPTISLKKLEEEIPF